MTTTYEPTAADRSALPASYSREDRYLGYRESDRARPFARYFRPDTLPIQDHVRAALLEGMSPTELGYGIEDAARTLSRPGHQKLETGWTTVPGGLLVAVLTDMPGVTAEMWDWWFGWHSTDSARYKLWNPDAHVFCALGDDRSADRTLTDRQRYRGNVSYVDEYIGGRFQRLAIRFVDPARLGFEDAGPGHTVVCARAGLSDYPVSASWVVHQVRPTEHGCEMRSRFLVGQPTVLPLPAHTVTGRGARLLTNPVARRIGDAALPHLLGAITGPTFGHDMLFHCAAEMNHLATFLPDLYEEFTGTP